MTDTDTATADHETSIQDVHYVLKGRALHMLESAVRDFTQIYGATVEQALQEVAAQAIYKSLLFVNLLSPEAQERVKDVPLIAFPPPPAQPEDETGEGPEA